MAQVSDPSLAARIDWCLDYLQQQWSGIPDMAAEWPDWDADSQLVFELNWNVPEDWLGQLTGWAGAGLLSPAQEKRYVKLQRLVGEQRPTLERLMATAKSLG